MSNNLQNLLFIKIIANEYEQSVIITIVRGRQPPVVSRWKKEGHELEVQKEAQSGQEGTRASVTDQSASGPRHLRSGIQRHAGIQFWEGLHDRESS